MDMMVIPSLGGETAQQHLRLTAEGQNNAYHSPLPSQLKLTTKTTKESPGDFQLLAQ